MTNAPPIAVLITIPEKYRLLTEPKDIENKGDLADKLEVDRQKMATQVIELQQSYNISRWLRSSAQSYPWRSR